VAAERNGRWDRAIELPGLGALNEGGSAGLTVSCGSAGSCAAGGNYTDRHGHSQGFVAAERNGRWDRAIELPGLGALNKGGSAGLAVSCGSAGNCAAAGDYTDARRQQQGFVAGEKKGRWGRAVEMPGLAALTNGRYLFLVFSVSCSTAGNCAAGGLYTDRSGGGEGFAIAGRNGRWGRAVEVPGLGALNKDGDANVFSVSCGSAGNCAAGGYYADSDNMHQGFATAEKSGRWGRATEIPGLAALNLDGDAAVLSLSCTPAGNCTAGGTYEDRDGNGQGFVT